MSKYLIINLKKAGGLGAMKIREFLKLTEEKSLEQMGKEKLLPCGVKKFRDFLKEKGFEPMGIGKKGWTYTDSDESLLEQDISVLVPHTASKQKQVHASASKKEITADAIEMHDKINIDVHANASKNESKVNAIKKPSNASKGIEKQLDALDMILQVQASKKPKRISRSFYIDDDILPILDSVKGGLKSDLVNEALRMVFRMKGLL